MSKLQHRIVAHHVGGRGFGVALNCPPGFANEVIHVLYEADEKCAHEMMAENKNANIRVLPYCLGAANGNGKIFITKNPYASSNFEPSPDYANHYCEVLLSGQIDGVAMDGIYYDAIYGNENRVVEVRDVQIRALDSIMTDGSIPDGLFPDFLSLDTQGSELNILKGGEKTFHEQCVALATEIEFHPMYKNQALFSDIFDFSLSHGFDFVGFTYLQEISSHRAAVGARLKGFLAFGDALFFRRIDSVESIAKSKDERYLKLLKLAFLALNFGYLEYCLQVLGAAEKVAPGEDFRRQLMRLSCFRILYDLQAAVSKLPPTVLHFDRSKLAAERKEVSTRASAQISAPAAVEMPVTPAPAQTWIDPAPGQRIRHLILTNPAAAVSKLKRHFELKRTAAAPPIQETLATSTLQAKVVSVSSPAVMANPVEAVLSSYGYVWWADQIRQRRQLVDRSVPGRMY